MRWSYGITTVPSRLHDLFPRTLESLKLAGFDRPHIFVDGGRAEDYTKFGLPVTVRSSNVRTAGNWVLALSEVYMRDPNADLFAVFQDDFVTYKNLRQYLERLDYPNNGYLNLYTFPENEKVRPKNHKGFYLSNQLGKSAIALVFDRVAVTKLMGNPYLWVRFQDAHRGHRAIDGGIVQAMTNMGYKEYVHWPSLTQHTGLESSMGNSRQQLSECFAGEDFDALALLQKEKQPEPKKVVQPTGVLINDPPRQIRVVPQAPPRPIRRGHRIGLVGYHANTGLGELNRQIVRYADVDNWLIKPHGKHGVNSLPDNVDCSVCPTGAKVDDFLATVDVVLFCETPYYPDLIAKAKKLDKKLVCVPMVEWLPEEGWVKDIDLFLCPTRQAEKIVQEAGLPSKLFSWPIDLERFEYRQRTVCNQFVFINGNGGFKGRKGADVVIAAKKLWPEMPLIVYDQTGQFPSSSRGATKTNAELYRDGDVLICPHSIDGLCLEPLEAAASGMLVVSTQGEPWDEYPAVERIPATSEPIYIKRPMLWSKPSAESLAHVCKSLLGRDIGSLSEASRKWAEARGWELFADKFNTQVRSVLTPN